MNKITNAIRTGWQAMLGRDQNKPEILKSRYRQIFPGELRYVKENPEMVAHIFTSDRMDQEERDREDEWGRINGADERAAEAMARCLRTENLINKCEASRPSVPEQHPEKDGPDIERD